MLFVLDNTLAIALSEEQKENNEITSMLVYLAQSLRLGKHLLFASRDTLNVLSTNEQLPEQTRAIYRHFLSRLPQLETYRSHFVTRIEIVTNEFSASTYCDSHCRVLRIPVRSFQDFVTFSETVLLSENQTDGKFYIELAKTFLVWHKLGRLSLRYDLRSGGGNTTGVEYKAIQDRKQRLCLCIVDSDKKTPFCDVGDTARKVIDEDNEEWLLSGYEVIEARDIENIIPTALLREAVDINTIHAVEAIGILENIDPDARKFVDIKKGLKLGEIYHTSRESSFVQYWENVFSKMKPHITGINCQNEPQCSKPQECSCIIVPACGEKVLQRVTDDVMTDKTPHKIAELVSDGLKPEWERIGSIISAWCCGSTMLSAI